MAEELSSLIAALKEWRATNHLSQSQSVGGVPSPGFFPRSASGITLGLANRTLEQPSQLCSFQSEGGIGLIRLTSCKQWRRILLVTGSIGPAWRHIVCHHTTTGVFMCELLTVLTKAHGIKIDGVAATCA
jgi:hypothetical protein